MLNHYWLSWIIDSSFSIHIQRTTNDERSVYISARPIINHGIVAHVFAHISNYSGQWEPPTTVLKTQTHDFSTINKGKPLTFEDPFLGALCLLLFSRFIPINCNILYLKFIYSETTDSEDVAQLQRTSLSFSVDIFYCFHFDLSILFSDYDCSMIFIYDIHGS